MMWGALSILGLIPQASAGDTDLDDLLSYDLEQLMQIDVVTAARRAQPLEEAPANVVVVTKEMIDRRGYRTLHELLMDVPGYVVGSGQPAGEYPTHFLFRGQGDVGQTKVLVMVDGVVVNDVSNGWSRHLGFEHHLIDVERVEIISGPGSALYGANAYAGVIHVITSRPEDLLEQGESVHVDARMGVGSWGTIAPELLVAARITDKVAVQLAGRVYRSRGDGGIGRADPGNYFTDNVHPDTALVDGTEAASPGPAGEALPEGFDTSIEDLSLRARVTADNFEIGLQFWDRREGLGSEVVGYEYFANDPDREFQAHHQGYSAFARSRMPISERVQAETTLLHRSTRVLPGTAFYYTYQYRPAGGRDIPVRKNYLGEGLLTGLDQQVDVSLSEHETFSNRLTAGFQLQHQTRQYFAIGVGPGLEAGSTINPSTFPDGGASVQPVFFSANAGVFLQDEQQLGRHTLTVGARVDADSLYPTSFNPRAALVLRPGDGVVVKLLYGEAYKAPTIFELYDEWRGNTHLLPQKIRTAELWSRARVGESLALTGSVSQSWAVNLIQVLPNRDTAAVPIGPLGQLSDYYQNEGTASFFGATGIVDVQVADRVRVSTNYVVTLGDGFSEIPNVPAHQVNAGVTVDVLDKLDANVRLNLASPALAPDSNRYWHPADSTFIADNYDYVRDGEADGHVPGHAIVNLALTGKNLYAGRTQLRPQLAVNNVLGTRWMTAGRQSGSGVRPVDQGAVANPSGFIPAYHPQPGREFHFKLQFEL
ncbi:MAG: TonB-dependent receptor [Proteobacteria bacterium]|nr:TonB-dependent receptor [Pseudomonadota bacterium]